MKNLRLPFIAALIVLAFPSFAAQAPPMNALGNTYPAYALNGNDLYMSSGITVPQFASISLLVGSSPGTVVAAVTGKKIRVLGYFFTNVTASGTAQFETSTGSAALTGAMSLAANGQASAPVQPFGYFETLSGDSLLLVETGTTNILSGWLVYCTY